MKYVLKRYLVGAVGVFYNGAVKECPNPRGLGLAVWWETASACKRKTHPPP